MSERFFPVRPNLDQLRHQAKDLLCAIRREDAEALAEFREHHPQPPEPAVAKLADAQFALARAYGLPSWPRLVTACQMSEAIWTDDIQTVRKLILKDPRLLHEQANGRPSSNWGPPMSYAANVGRLEIVRMLRAMGAKDVGHAFGRAALQGKLETARELYAMEPVDLTGEVMGPCETLNGDGLEFLLSLGAPFADSQGNRLAPLGLILETYSRRPQGKHKCLELVAQLGVDFPDTPVMALHRGRIDLLEAHLRRDPDLLSRTFTHEEIYLTSLGCHEDQSLALHGTPLAGGTLLHLAVDDDAEDLALWLLDHGADPNTPAAVDADGFGGHTALFGCIVSQPYRCGRQKNPTMTQLLLERGADPNIRVNLRKRLRFVEDETLHEYRGVTPLSWGERFHDQDWVNRAAMKLVAEAGGRP